MFAYAIICGNKRWAFRYLSVSLYVQYNLGMKLAQTIYFLIHFHCIRGPALFDVDDVHEDAIRLEGLNFAASFWRQSFDDFARDFLFFISL